MKERDNQEIFYPKVCQSLGGLIKEGLCARSGGR